MNIASLLSFAHLQVLPGFGIGLGVLICIRAGRPRAQRD